MTGLNSSAANEFSAGLPRVVPSIDAIARKLNRDVLFLRFMPIDAPYPGQGNFPDVREKILNWLNNNGIRWIDCADIASETGWRAWRGEVFLPDAIPDETNPITTKMNAYLENPDGSTRFEGVTFCMLSLRIAQKNSRHDDPSFQWDL